MLNKILSSQPIEAHLPSTIWGFCDPGVALSDRSRQVLRSSATVLNDGLFLASTIVIVMTFASNFSKNAEEGFLKLMGYLILSSSAFCLEGGMAARFFAHGKETGHFSDLVPANNFVERDHVDRQFLQRFIGNAHVLRLFSAACLTLIVEHSKPSDTLKDLLPISDSQNFKLMALSHVWFTTAAVTILPQVLAEMDRSFINSKPVLLFFYICDAVGQFLNPSLTSHHLIKGKQYLSDKFCRSAPSQLVRMDSEESQIIGLQDDSPV